MRTGRLECGVALVVGASSGIGQRAALVFAQAGRPLVLAARRTERLESVGAEVSRLGLPFATVRIDVTDTASVDDAVAWTEQSVGPVQVLFNGAGIGLAGSLANTQPEASLMSSGAPTPWARSAWPQPSDGEC